MPTVPIPVDIVDAPRISQSSDGRLVLDWIFGRGSTWISADLLERMIDRFNSATEAEKRGAVKALRAEAERTYSELVANALRDRADRVESGEVKI